MLSNFPDLEKVWEVAIKSGKMVKSLEFFFFLSYSKSYSILSVHLQYIIEKSFVPVFFKVSIDHSFDNPESGKSKKNIVLEKVWKKS